MDLTAVNMGAQVNYLFKEYGAALDGVTLDKNRAIACREY